MPELKLKCLIKWVIEGSLERVLCYHPDGKHYYCFNVEQKSAWPFLRRCDELERAIASGKEAFVLAQDPFEAKLRPTPSPEHEKMQKDAYAVIKDLVDDKQRLVYDRKTAGAEIRRAAAAHSLSGEKPVHPTTVTKYLRRFWQRGATIDALQPDLHKCGGRGKDRTPGELKLGDVDTNGEKVGINVTQHVKDCFEAAITRYYHNKERPYSFDKTYTLMLGDSFVSGYSKKNGEITPDKLPREKCPTLAQFRYYYNKKYRRVEALQARLGDNFVEQNCRGGTADQSKSASGIGQIYQIDATTADVYLVDTDTQRLTVGRPVIYLAIDTLSKLVAGLHVTFCHMSYDAARMAVWNAYRDKSEYCKSIGFELSDPKQWPARGLPQFLRADRGELLSAMSDRIVRVGIDITNEPAYCPTAKAIVERFFGKLNSAVIDFLPGVVPEPDRRPGKKDPCKHAAATLLEFTHQLIHAILAYNTTVIEYIPTDEMKRDGVLPIPCKIWEWGWEHNRQVHDMDPRKVRIGLLPSGEATVREEGIRFGSLFYTCEKARLERWFDDQKAKNNSWKIACAYEPDMVDHIFLLGETFEEMQVCDLMDKHLTFAGYTWAEVEAYRKEEGKLHAALEEDKHREMVASQAAIRNITTRVDERRKRLGLPDTSKRQETQVLEKVAEGQREALKTFGMVGTNPLQPAPMPTLQFEEGKVADEWEHAFEARKKKKVETNNHEQGK